jgi:TPP-dependent 2-oxoacid decarboxylase
LSFDLIKLIKLKVFIYDVVTNLFSMGIKTKKKVPKQTKTKKKKKQKHNSAIKQNNSAIKEKKRKTILAQPPTNQ